MSFDAHLHSDTWQQRRADVLEHHPLYHRTIRRSELPSLRQVVAAAFLLPTKHQTYPPARVAYLFQGEQDTAAREAACWSNNDAAFTLTYRVAKDSALFFPNSTYPEGYSISDG